MCNFIILKGGRTTPGVLRKGNVVYRPHKITSDFSNKILLFFEQNQIPYTQRFLGVDDSGRDMFAYINGYVPDEIGETTLEQLCLFMRIVKKIHDCSLKFTNTTQVICHNDLSPCNTVFLNNAPIAIIDWDSASIGERWEDLSYIVWLWINIGSHRRNEIDIIGQMKTALTAYGADKQTLLDFADKLTWRMDKVVNDMPITNYQFKRTKDWVAFSKLWIKENRNLITEEIG